MKRSFSLIVSLVVVVAAMGQGFQPEKVNPKAVRLYEQSMTAAGNDDFKTGISLLKQAVQLSPGYADAWLSIAGMYGELKQYDSAIFHYEKARAIDTVYFRDYNLPYSINLAGKGRFADALVAINKFSTINDLNASSLKAAAYRTRCYQFAVSEGQKPELQQYQFQPKNLGDSVNTAVSEYFPSLTIDNEQLVFTRRVNNNNEDFFETRQKPGHWSTARGLTGAINSNLNEGAQTLSQDGEWLIFTGCNFPDGLGSCDLYVSFLGPQGWSEPENLGETINTEFWESAPSLSPDKKDLYFASRRSDGYGGSDIWVSHLQPNGRWTAPENLGPEINTSGDETCPFIHADNQTLYFVSNGLQGYGGDDLFMARKGPKGNFSLPKNLGYPINTIENEGSLVITADGSTAYYAADQADSRGGLDLYTFSMRPDVRPIKTLWIKGKVFDANTKKGLPSAIELTDISTRQVISNVQTDETGNYLVTLPVGRDYAFNVNRRGYLFSSENFSLREKAPDSTYHIDIPLQPIAANATIVLKNIFFESNSTALGDQSQVELEKLVQMMKDNPSLQIQINGHTDNIGKAADNLKLSNGRAQSVVNFLIKSGINAGRLKFQGFGATVPLAENTTEEGRSKNRRTELKVLAQ